MWIYLTLLTPLLAIPALIGLDRLERWTRTVPPAREVADAAARPRRADRARSVGTSHRRDVVSAA
jgi:hypothetical protein